MGSTQAEDLISTIGLAIAFGLLVIAGLYALCSGSHPRTRMIRGFVTIGVMASCFRFLYFAIPDEAWGQPEVPTEPRVRFSLPWWTTWLQYVDYSLGNIGFFAQQGVILYFWMSAYRALQLRGADMTDRPNKLYVRAVLAYALLELILVVVFFFTSFFTVICIHSVLQALTSFALAVVFVSLFWRLRAALQPEEGAGLLQTRAGGGSGGYGAASPLTRGTGASPSSGAAAMAAGPDAGEQERQRKMNKITTIAIVCTVANIFRGCVMIYQSAVFFSGHVVAADFWWLVILLNYGFTEVFAFAAVLYILRRPPSRRSAAKPTPSGVGAGGDNGVGGVAGADRVGGRDDRFASLTGSTPGSFGQHLSPGPFSLDRDGGPHSAASRGTTQQQEGGGGSERAASSRKHSSSTVSVSSMAQAHAHADRPGQLTMATVSDSAEVEHTTQVALRREDDEEAATATAAETRRGVDLGAVSASFGDDRFADDYSSVPGSDGGGVAWASSTGGSSGGANRDDLDDDDLEDDGRWHGGVMLATSTIAGHMAREGMQQYQQVLSPLGSSGYSELSAMASADEPAGVERLPPPPPPSATAAAAATAAAGGVMAGDSVPLEPVKESVESDVAFPQAATKR